MQPHETVAESSVDGVSPASVPAHGTAQSSENAGQLAPNRMASDLASAPARARTLSEPTLNVATRGEGGAVSEPASPVAAALSGLDGLENQPLADHVAVYDGVHAVLTNALSDIDKATG